MKVTVIGAGNSGLAMAAHLSREGNVVTLWNRSYKTIEKLMQTHIIRCSGVICGDIPIHQVTTDIQLALKEPDIILITTPANSHRELAELIGKNIRKSTVIVLNPGRTLGALEFCTVYERYNKEYPPMIAETQTIIYTCRKTGEDAVDVIALKNDVLISALDMVEGKQLLSYLPECMRRYLIVADSMIQTSIGNVGMILHCAPLLFNIGWTESRHSTYRYYYDGIAPTIGDFIEKLDEERVAVSIALGHRVETTREWIIRTYRVTGNTLYECIQNNPSYKSIEAPRSLRHRYIFEDIPCGLVPLEAIGLRLGLDMKYTTMIIELASRLLNVDFRKEGRNLEYLKLSHDRKSLMAYFKGGLCDEG